MTKKFLSIISVAALVTMLAVTVVSARIYNPVSVDTSSFLTSSSTPTLTGLWNFSAGASVSAGTFEVAGTASISAAVFKTITAPTTTSTTAAITGLGQFKFNTASLSINFGDGSNEIVDPTTRCMAYKPASNTSIHQEIGKRFLDPFTITQIAPIASGSNAVGWQLFKGAPGSVTTAVFSANKSASSSTAPIYTTFANASIGDGQELDIKITSSSAVVTQFSVTVCGKYTK